MKPTKQNTNNGANVNDAMAGIEQDDPSRKEVLPKKYARPALHKQCLGRTVVEWPSRHDQEIATIGSARDFRQDSR